MDVIFEVAGNEHPLSADESRVLRDKLHDFAAGDYVQDVSDSGDAEVGRGWQMAAEEVALLIEDRIKTPGEPIHLDGHHARAVFVVVADFGGFPETRTGALREALHDFQD